MDFVMLEMGEAMYPVGSVYGGYTTTTPLTIPTCKYEVVDLKGGVPGNDFRLV